LLNMEKMILSKIGDGALLLALLLYP